MSLYDYQKLFFRLYSNEPCHKKAWGDLVLAYKYADCRGAQWIGVVRNNELLAHAGLWLIDKQTAVFGFCEAVDEQALLDLWQMIKTKAKEAGAKILVGPINGSIWHGYRATVLPVAGWAAYEVFTPSFYVDFFKAAQPLNLTEFYSARRDNPELVVAKLLNHNTSLPSGVDLESVSYVSEQTLRSIYRLSINVFNNSYLVQGLEWEDFRDLYGRALVPNQELKLHLAWSGSELLGFCYCLLQDRDYVLKTIAVATDWRGRGLAKYLILAAHKDCLERDCQSIIYAMMRRDGDLTNFPRYGVSDCGEYLLYTYQL